MVIRILLIIAILLQVVAVIMSLRLMRLTKYNAAWILFSIAFIGVLFQLLGELVNLLGKEIILPKDFMLWVGVISGLCFTGGLFVVNKLISYIDIMEHKRRLTEKRILNTIISTEEKERRRFSKDLHDGLGPLLSSVRMSISALSGYKNMDNSEREIIQNADYVISEALKTLKEISNNLSPHILNNFGLNRALNNFINKLTLPTNVKVSYLSNMKSERLPEDVEVVLYRVACELINNALKHSHCTNIDVTLRKDNNSITLIVCDDGCGFDYDYTMNESLGGMGLSNISSRISSLKGVMTVKSKHNQGTAIEIYLKNCLK